MHERGDDDIDKEKEIEEEGGEEVKKGGDDDNAEVGGIEEPILNEDDEGVEKGQEGCEGNGDQEELKGDGDVDDEEEDVIQILESQMTVTKRKSKPNPRVIGSPWTPEGKRQRQKRTKIVKVGSQQPVEVYKPVFSLDLFEKPPRSLLQEFKKWIAEGLKPRGK